MSFLVSVYCSLQIALSSGQIFSLNMVDCDSLSNESGAVGPSDGEASPAADSLPSAWKHHRWRFHLQWKEVGPKSGIPILTAED